MRFPSKLTLAGLVLALSASTAGATPFIHDVWRVKAGGAEIGRVAATAATQPTVWSEWVEKRDASWTYAGPGVPWDIEPTTATSLNCNVSVGGVTYRKCQENGVLAIAVKRPPTSAITQPSAANSERVVQYHANGRYLVTAKTGTTTTLADLYISTDAIDPAMRREVFCAGTGFAWPMVGTPPTSWRMEWVSADAVPAACPAGRETRYEAKVDLSL